MKEYNAYGSKKECSIIIANEGNNRSHYYCCINLYYYFMVEKMTSTWKCVSIPFQIQNMRDLVEVSDEDCKNKLLMDRSNFHRLCYLLQLISGLKTSKYIIVPEKVTMFLSILAHHTKNRYLHNILLVKPQPILDDSTDPCWGKFKVTLHSK
ncbi:hypothetical protein ACS0TY_030658 [Phlomoides rotata]